MAEVREEGSTGVKKKKKKKVRAGRIYPECCAIEAEYPLAGDHQQETGYLRQESRMELEKSCSHRATWRSVNPFLEVTITSLTCV